MSCIASVVAEETYNLSTATCKRHPHSVCHPADEMRPARCVTGCEDGEFGLLVRGGASVSKERRCCLAEPLCRYPRPLSPSAGNNICEEVKTAVKEAAEAHDIHQSPEMEGLEFDM
jgi:hypothetical protein